MLKSARSKAEEQFIATQKKDKKALDEKEKAWQKTTNQIASLRAQRLAKEAADEEATEKAEAEKAVTKKAVAKKASSKKK